MFDAIIVKTAVYLSGLLLSVLLMLDGPVKWLTCFQRFKSLLVTWMVLSFLFWVCLEILDYLTGIFHGGSGPTPPPPAPVTAKGSSYEGQGQGPVPPPPPPPPTVPDPVQPPPPPPKQPPRQPEPQPQPTQPQQPPSYREPKPNCFYCGYPH